MKLSTQEEYGLRCLLQIGRHEKLTGQSMTISEISQAEGLTPANVGKIVRLLRLGNFVESVRGHTGGYKLAKPADQIRIADVLSNLGGPLFTSDFCEEHAGHDTQCTHSVNCSIRPLWHAIQFVVDQMLDRVTLKDLLGDENRIESGLKDRADELLQVAPIL